MEVGDVFADEMVNLGSAVRSPEIIEVQTSTVTEILETGHVADRRIQPDIEIFAGSVWDFKAPVRRIARDIPFLQAGGEPFVELVDHLWLDRSTGDPVLQHGLEIGQLEKEVQRFLGDRRRARHDRARVFQLGGRIGGAAILAAIAVLIRGTAAWAFAFNVAIR